MPRKICVIILASSLLAPTVLAPQSFGAETSAGPNDAANAPASSASRSPQNSARKRHLMRNQRTARQASPHRKARSYHGISKKEWIFLGAIVGTSMAIGAIAGGGQGLAIGTIVGGWAAYAAHRLLKW